MLDFMVIPAVGLENGPCLDEDSVHSGCRTCSVHAGIWTFLIVVDLNELAKDWREIDMPRRFHKFITFFELKGMV